MGLGLSVARGFTEATGGTLTVEDTPGGGLTFVVSHHGCDVTVAADGAVALRAAADTHPDVVVLDLGLPDLEGTEVIEGLRGWTAIPIIVLSARDASGDKVRALDAGADDYVTKPFGMAELLARLRAAVRRAATAGPDGDAVVEAGDLHIDLAAKRVARDGVEVHARSGARPSAPRPTTCACTWPSCAAGWRRSRPARDT